jgi:hypothetical protein
MSKGGMNFKNLDIKPVVQTDAVKKAAKRIEQSGETYTDEGSGLQRIGGGNNFYGQARPDFYTKRGADGELADKFKTELGESAQFMKEQGMREGDSVYAENARAKQDMIRQGQMDDASRSSIAALTNANQQAMMRGGQGGGASERASMFANRNLMDQQQNVQNSYGQNNLNISMDDAKSKQAMLGRVGQAEQIVNESNVNALRGDYDTQNKVMSDFYKSDTEAWGAKQTADAQRKAGRGGGCFYEDQTVELNDGSYIDICDVEIGDELKVGGFVYSTIAYLSDHYFEYKGVKVSGKHMVFEDGVAKRVEDCDQAIKTLGEFKLYSISNEDHKIEIDDVLFADFDEVDNTDEYTNDERLRMLNA